MKDVERRAITTVEIRADVDEESRTIVGHAAVFGQLSHDLGGFREKVAPGAFSKTIGGDVRALFNHDPNIVLGRTRSKTLTLTEDARGLAVSISPPDTETGRHILEGVKRGDISEMSFGFRTLSDTWDRDGDEIIRTLNEVELFDVSLATFPAYPQTDAAVRALQSWTDAQCEAREGLAAEERDLFKRRLAVELI